MGTAVSEFASGFMDGMAIAARKKKASNIKLNSKQPIVATTGNSLGGNTGALDRLKAGNIDQPGSEASNRWGQGKAAGDTAELAREGTRATPLAEKPSGNAETSMAEYEAAWNEDPTPQDTAQADASALLTDEPW